MLGRLWLGPLALLAGGVGVGLFLRRLPPRPRAAAPHSARLFFYLYDSPEFEDLYYHCSQFSKLTHPGAAAEWHFAAQLRGHEWRVRDGRRAALYVVPVYMSLALQGGCGHWGAELHRRAAMVVANSQFYKRNSGQDHVLLAGDLVNRSTVGWLVPGMENAAVGVVSECGTTSPDWKCAVAAPSALLPLVDALVWPPKVNPTNYAVERRQISFFFQGKTLKTKESLESLAQERRSVLRSTDDTSLGICGASVEPGLCYAAVDHHRKLRDGIRIARHALCLPPFNTCLYEAVAHSTMAVLVRPADCELPFGCIVPWEQIIDEVKEADLASDAVGSVRESFDQTRTRVDLSARLSALETFAPHILWEAPHSRAASNVLLHVAHQCFGYGVAGFSC